MALHWSLGQSVVCLSALIVTFVSYQKQVLHGFYLPFSKCSRLRDS